MDRIGRERDLRPLWLAICASVILPGAGHIVLERFWRGMILAAAYAAAVTTALSALVVYAGSGANGLGYAAAGASAALWLAALLDATRLHRRIGADLADPGRETHFLGAIQSSLKGEHEGAIEELELCLKLAPDDPDVYMRLADAYRRLGDRDRARRALRTCRNLDTRGKWQWEIQRELEGLGEPK